MPPNKDLRRSERIAHSFLVRYGPARGGSRWLVSQLTDFSRAGARFIAEHPFVVGDALTLQLLLPASRELVSVNARVTWVRPTARGAIALVEVGVAFDAVDAAAQQVLEAAVAHFLRLQRQGEEG